MANQESVNWQCFADIGTKLGEVPTWSSPDNALFWIDSHSGMLHKTDFTNRTTSTWKLPAAVGSFGLCKDRRFAVVAIETGIVRLDLQDGSVEILFDAPYDRTNFQFNDGKCDPAGRFWVGTMRKYRSTLPNGTAAFYRVDDRGMSAQITDITIANGLAWSPDGRTMYIADRPNWQILAFDYDVRTGEATNRRRFVSVTEGEIPDGAAVDADGGYWIAMFRAGRILRFTPDGRLDRDLKAPTSFPTMVTFGGPDLSTMFVTTANVPPKGSATPEAHAGAVFCAKVGALGLEAHNFSSSGTARSPNRS